MQSLSEPLLCFTEVEWREVGDENTSEPHWPRNETCPGEGEVRWANLNSGNMPPGDALKIGQSRWMLFEPGFAYFNGFDQDENPQDLDLCAIIEVELLQVFPPRSDLGRSTTTWTQCLCLRTVPLFLIPTIFPPIPVADKRASNLLGTFGKKMTHFMERGEYSNWYMVTNPAATQSVLPHLVLSGFSTDSYGFISNWVVEHDKTSWKAA